METNQFFSSQLISSLDIIELVNILFLGIEWWIWFNRTLMVALRMCAFE
jgi:hypothetical protein